MVKIVLFPVLLLAACLVAGLYGALHNQVSYTVSPAYFHELKFQQFDIPEHLRGRLGASLVGWYASWWIGLLLGIPILIVSLILPGWQVYLSRCLLAFLVVATTALLVGLGALVYASLVPLSAFDRAETMHSYSYTGGFLGIITSTLYLIMARVRLDRQRRRLAKAAYNSCREGA